MRRLLCYLSLLSALLLSTHVYAFGFGDVVDVVVETVTFGTVNPGMGGHDSGMVADSPQACELNLTYAENLDPALVMGQGSRCELSAVLGELFLPGFGAFGTRHDGSDVRLVLFEAERDNGVDRDKSDFTNFNHSAPSTLTDSAAIHTQSNQTIIVAGYKVLAGNPWGGCFASSADRDLSKDDCSTPDDAFGSYGQCTRMGLNGDLIQGHEHCSIRSSVPDPEESLLGSGKFVTYPWSHSLYTDNFDSEHIPFLNNDQGWKYNFKTSIQDPNAAGVLSADSSTSQEVTQPFRADITVNVSASRAGLTISGHGRIDLRYLRFTCKSGGCLKIIGDVDVNFAGVEMYLDPDSSDAVPYMLDIESDENGAMPRIHYVSKNSQYPGLMIVPHPYHGADLGQDAAQSTAIVRYGTNNFANNHLRPILENAAGNALAVNVLNEMILLGNVGVSGAVPLLVVPSENNGSSSGGNGEGPQSTEIACVMTDSNICKLDGGGRGDDSQLIRLEPTSVHTIYGESSYYVDYFNENILDADGTLHFNPDAIYYYDGLRVIPQFSPEVMFRWVTSLLQSRPAIRHMTPIWTITGAVASTADGVSTAEELCHQQNRNWDGTTCLCPNGQPPALGICPVVTASTDPTCSGATHLDTTTHTCKQNEAPAKAVTPSHSQEPSGSDHHVTFGSPATGSSTSGNGAPAASVAALPGGDCSCQVGLQPTRASTSSGGVALLLLLGLFRWRRSLGV